MAVVVSPPRPGAIWDTFQMAFFKWLIQWGLITNYLLSGVILQVP